MNLRLAFILLALLTLSTALVTPCKAETLSLTASVEKPTYDKGEVVVIRGSVLDSKGSAVPYATVSLEVIGPTGSQVHIAMIFSGPDGSFSDEFTVPEGVAEGAYTVYIVASKTGYEDGALTTTYTVIPEFGFDKSFTTALIIAMMLIAFSINRRSSSSTMGHHLQ
jgi:hypothetical protein